MKNIIISILVVLSITTYSCSDFLEVNDLDDLDINATYKTEEDLSLALNDLYTTLPTFDLEDNLYSKEPDQAYFVPYFWTDDAVHRNINGAGTMGSDYVWGADVRALRSFYRYQDIAQINFFLGKLADATFTTESNRARFGAEARFFRAWIYESMLFAYGDVPLITEIIEADDSPERTPRKEVFDYVINELDSIYDELPWEYTDEGDNGRITKGAVLALKSRAYLNSIGWTDDVSNAYKMAEVACDSIISSGIYSLVSGIDGYAEQFTSESDLVSTETILSNMYIEEFRTHRYARQIALRGTWRGESGTLTNSRRPGFSSDFIEEALTMNNLFPSDDPSGYDPANPWVNRDPRLAVSVVLPYDTLPATSSKDDDFIFDPYLNHGTSSDDIGGVNCPTGYGFRKYLDYDLLVINEGNVDLKLIRYSEILLMYAEALAGQGDDGNALNYLNMVHTRVGMPAYTLATLPSVTRGTTGNSMIDAILLERRYEFAGEGPQRWFDIWRYKLGDQVIKPVYGITKDPDLPGDLNIDKYSAANGTTFEREWKDTYYLLPIWQTYLDANPSLTQNPGY